MGCPSSTRYGAHSTAEGVDPNQRAHESGGFLHLCVDWDATFDDEEFEEIVRLIDHEYQ